MHDPLSGISSAPHLQQKTWQVLEQQVWDLAMLVRGQGEEPQHQQHVLPLRRCERLRRTLDARIYEVLLLHVRTRLIWDGFIGDDDDEGDGGGSGD